MQVLSQIALVKAQLYYFVVWTSKDLLVELNQIKDIIRVFNVH